MANAKIEGNSALVSWPVDVCFNGSRTFDAVLDFGGRQIQSITLDPGCRFPDHDTSDNVWPTSAPPAPRGQGRGMNAGGGRGGGQASGMCQG